MTSCTRRLWKVALASLVALSPLGALASYTCTGPVASLGIWDNGDVAYSLSGSQWTQVHMICNLHAPFNAVTVESCKAFYATLLTARATGQQVTAWYRDDGLTCSTQPGWNEVKSLYFLQGLT